jgi:hypothetical protein
MSANVGTDREAMIADLLQRYREEQLQEDIADDVGELRKEAVDTYCKEQLLEDIADDITDLERNAVNRYRKEQLEEDIADDVAELEKAAIEKEEEWLSVLSDDWLKKLCRE